MTKADFIDVTQCHLQATAEPLRYRNIRSQISLVFHKKHQNLSKLLTKLRMCANIKI